MESKSNKHSLCIIIPMYNEEKGAAACIDAISKEIVKINYRTQLLIVNDGSTDKTLEILKNKQKQYKKLIIITHLKNKGYGKALQTGIREAVKEHFTYGLFMDSDLTNNPKYIKSFAQLMKENYDCVKASRYIKNGKVIGVSWYRRIISILGNSIASKTFAVGINDCTNGFRMVKLELLKKLRFHENSFPIILEEMYYLKKKHAKFLEIPVVLTARKNTKSHFTYKPVMFYNYFKYTVQAIFI